MFKNFLYGKGIIYSNTRFFLAVVMILSFSIYYLGLQINWNILLLLLYRCDDSSGVPIVACVRLFGKVQAQLRLMLRKF